jgi:hypothetical protein
MVIKFKVPDSRQAPSGSEFEDLLRRSYKYLVPRRPQLLPKPAAKPQLKNPAA